MPSSPPHSAPPSPPSALALPHSALSPQHSALALPIRVVRVIDRLNVGGPAKHVVWLTAGLRERAFETVLVTGTVPPSEGDMGYFAQAVGVEPCVIKGMSRELSPRDILVLGALLWQFWRLKPQIVHTHKAKAGALGRIAALLYKWLTPSALWLRPRQCCVVHTYHGHVLHSYYGAVKTRLFIAIERALARLCTDRIITVSEQQRHELAEHFRIGRPEQFRVISLGIDLDEMAGRHGRLRAELGLTDDALLIGIVGRLCEVKHHAMLLEAAAQLVAQPVGLLQQAHFVIIGDGHLRAPLESLAHSLGLTDRVTFTGFRDDAVALYPELDLVALTSLNEGTPLTLIEAMACGRAVVSTEVGGVVDIMGARQTSCHGFCIWDHGLTTASRDVEAFAHALQYLLERPTLRHEMGERGRAFVQAHLSKERLMRDIEGLYRELVKTSAEC